MCRNSIIGLFLVMALSVPLTISGQSLSDYTMIQGTDATKWVTITNTTSLLTGTGDAVGSTVQDIGFVFPFGKQSYSQFSVNADGNLRFGSTANGSGGYSTPFGSSVANTNSPKINFFGCDGYMPAGGYVYAQLFGQAPNRKLVVEFSTSTYSQRNSGVLFNWQIHLYENGEFEVVFPGQQPTAAPSTSRQMGACVNRQDGFVIWYSGGHYYFSPFSDGSSTGFAANSWPDNNRYFHFTPGTCDRPKNVAFTDITSNSATVSWTGDEGTYNLSYGLKGTSTSTWTSMTVEGDFTATIPNLAAGTDYQLRLWRTCGPGNQSAITVYSFTTEPEVIMSLPYSCDFEGDCRANWVMLNGSQTNKWMIGNGGSGTNNYMFISNNNLQNTYTNNSSTNRVYAYAPIYLDAGYYTISYDWKCYGETYDYMRVFLAPGDAALAAGQSYSGYSTYLDGNNKLNLNSDWKNQTAQFRVTEDGVYLIVFHWYNNTNTGSNPPAAVDNIVINQTTCPYDGTVSASGITSSSATVSWTGDNGSYHVEYGPVGFTRGNGTKRVVNALSTNISNLQSNTEYDVYVRRICGPADTSVAVKKTFKTMLMDHVSLPFVCDFEAADASDNWRFATNNTNQWYIGTVDNNTTGGSKAMYVSGDEGATNTYNTYSYGEVYAYTLLSFESEAQHLIQFDYRMGGSDMHFLRVGLIPVAGGYDASGWGTSSYPSYPSNAIVLDGNQALYNRTEWQRITRYVDVSPGEYFLVFYWRDYQNSNYATQPGPNIDNIVIRPYTCYNPENLAASNVTSSSASISWSGTSTSYQVEYGPTGFTLGQGTVRTVATSSIALSNLDAGTKYDVYVHGICGDNDLSDKVSASFFTLPNPQPVPFSCDFEADGDATKWAFYSSSSTNDWAIGSATNNTTDGAKALYISDDNGVTNNASGSGDYQAFAYTHLSLNAGSYTIKYDWKAEGNINYGTYLRVALVPASSGYDACCWNTSGTPGITLDGGTVLYSTSTFANWESKDIDFDVAESGNYLLVFCWSGHGNAAWYTPPAAIDNVELMANTCPAPTNLTATPVSSTSHTISWTGTASQYTVEYGTTATASGTYGSLGYTLNFNNQGTKTTITVTGNSVTLTNLQPAMDYQFVVRALCDDVPGKPATGTFTTLLKDPVTELPIPAQNASVWTCWAGGYWNYDNSANTRSFRPYYNDYGPFEPKDYYYSNNGVYIQGHYDLAAGSTSFTCNDDFHVNCSPTSTNSQIWFFAVCVLQLDPGTYTLDQDYWCSVGKMRIALVPANINPIMDWNLNNWTAYSVPGTPLDGGQYLTNNSQWDHYNTSFTISETGIYYLTYRWEAPSYSSNSGPVGVNNIVLDFVPAPSMHHIARSVTGNGSIQISGQTVAGGNYANEGSEITITATPESDAYGLQYLIVDGQLVTSPHTKTVSSDVNIEAIFIPVDRPDLHVVDITCPANVTTGQTVQVSWTVRNDGLAATSSSWIDRIYLVTDPSTTTTIGTDCIKLKTQDNFNALAPDESYTKTETVTIPNNIVGGDYYFVVTANINRDDQNTFKVTCADGTSPEENDTPPFCTVGASSKSFVEANETYNYGYISDNVLAKHIQVVQSLPELHITSFSIPDELVTNQSATISWTVTNDGTEPTPSNKTWTDFLYLSTTPEITYNGTNYTLLGSWSNVRALPVGESYTREVTVTIPATYEEAYLILISDAKYAYNIQCPDGIDPLNANDVSTYQPINSYCTAKSFCLDYDMSNKNDVNKILEISESGTVQSEYITSSFNRTWRHDNFVIKPVTILQRFPDLQPSNLSFPSGLTTYKTIDVSWTVTNDGLAATPSSWVDRLYISLDNSTSDGTLLWNANSLNLLGVGESYTRSVTVTIPGDLATGEYYLIATADDKSVSSPTHIDQQLPDLSVASVSHSDLCVGYNISISFTVANSGAIMTPENVTWTDRVYLSTTPDLSGSLTTLWSGSNLRPLLTSDSYTRTVSVTISQPGDYYLIVSADHNNNVWEPDEVGTSNQHNLYAEAVNVSPTPLPQLHAISLNCTDIYTGHLTNASFTIRNEGLAATPNGTTWYDYLYLSTTPYGRDELLGSWQNVSTIEAGQAYTRDVSFTLPLTHVTDGDFYLVLVSNPDPDPLLFGDHYPTTLSVPVTLLLPPVADLQVTNIFNYPITFYSGRSLSLKYKVTNVGDGPTSSNGWRDLLFMSTNPDITDFATLVAEGTILAENRISIETPLVSGSSVSSSFLCEMTPPEMYGTYYLYVATNVDDDEYEHVNTSNNVTRSTNPVDIMLGFLCDLKVSFINADEEATHDGLIKVNYTVINTLEKYRYPCFMSYGDVERDASFFNEFYMPRWTDKVYLSNTPDLSGIEIGSDGQPLTANNSQLTANADWFYCLQSYPDAYPDYFIRLVSVFASSCEDSYIYHDPNNGGRYSMPNNILMNGDRGKYIIARAYDGYPSGYNRPYPSFLPETGNYYIVVKVDTEDDVLEFGAEDNNLVSTPITLNRYHHNFTLTDLSLDRSSLVPGYSVNADIILHNAGGLNFSDSLIFQVYCSNTNVAVTDGRIDTTTLDTEAATGNVTRLVYSSKEVYNLKHETQRDLSLRIPIPADLPDGQYTLHFVVNPAVRKVTGEEVSYERLPEAFYEDNMVMSAPIDICAHCPMPDLMPDRLILPPPIFTAGEEVTIEFDIYNNGQEDLNGTTVHTAFHVCRMGTNDWIWCPVMEQTSPLPVAHPTTQGMGHFDHYVQVVKIPPTLEEGEYICRLTADASDNVMEAVEHDNVKYYGDLVYIKPHPLFVAIRTNDVTPRIPSAIAPGDPSTMQAGEPYTIMWVADLAQNKPLYRHITPEERNDIQGFSDSADWRLVTENEVAWVDRIYFSTDATLSDDDILLKSVGISQAKVTVVTHPRAYTASAQNVRIPRDIVGEGYIIIAVDADGISTDTNRTNNIYAKLVTVTEANPEEEEDPNGTEDPNSPYNPYSPSNPSTPSGQEPETNLPCDLTVTALNIPEQVHQKDVVEIEYTVKNLGENPAKLTRVDNLYDCGQDKLVSELMASYFYLEGKTHRNVIAPGASYTGTIRVVFPDSEPGRYPITLWTDARGNLDDTDPTNNFLTVYYDLLEAPPCDLTVSFINNPSQLHIGSNMHVKWRIKNIGYNSLNGTVHDAIYLSTDQTLDNDDYLIGEFSEAAYLESNASTLREADFSLQGVPEGNYYLIVRTNTPNAFKESDYDNNRVVSETMVSVSLPTLYIGQYEEFTLRSNYTTAYRLDISPSQAGKTLAIIMTTDAPTRSFNGLYLSYEEMPTTGHHEYSTNRPYVEQQQVVVPKAEAGTYYLLVSGTTTNGNAQQITLLARVLEFGIISVEANTGSNAGTLTATVTGASFDSIMDFRLVKHGSTDNSFHPAQNVKYKDATTNYVTFNLTDLPVGSYDMIAELPGGIVSRKAEAFEVSEGLPADLRCNLYAPDEVRVDQNVEIIFEYYNAGGNDLDIAGFMIVSANNHPVRETPFSIPEIIEMNRVTHDWPDTLVFFTGEPGMDPGIIRPGHGGTKRFFVFANKLFDGDELDIKIYAVRFNE